MVAWVCATYAQAAAVTIYGKVEPSLDVIRAGDSEIVTMNSNTSRLGFKGTEDLGGGLKAVFQIESKLDVANQGEGTDGFADRDSWAGLQGAFGTLVFGTNNSAYKESSSKYDPFDDSIGDYKTIMGMGYNNAGKIKQGDANQRYKQTAHYESPRMNGVTFSANYALEEAKTDTTDKRAWSAALRYDSGPFNLFGAYDRQTKNNGDTDDLKSWKVGVAYAFSSGTTVRGIVEKMKKEDATQPLNTQHVFIGVEQRLTAQLMVMTNHMRAEDERGEAGARAWNIGANYAFSRRTSVLVVYTYLKNEVNANYKNDADDDNYVAKGDVVKGYSLRLQHKF